MNRNFGTIFDPVLPEPNRIYGLLNLSNNYLCTFRVTLTFTHLPSLPNHIKHNTFFSPQQQSVLQARRFDRVAQRNVVLCNTDCWCGEKKVLAMNTQQESTLKHIKHVELLLLPNVERFFPSVNSRRTGCPQ